MGSFPGSPRTVRGALVAVDPAGPVSNTVIFQYNPDQVTRTLRPRGAPSESAVGPVDAYRIWGAPVETVSMNVEIDATDQLETGDPVAAASGIAPQLAALELLLYPDTDTVIANNALLAAGTIEILPAFEGRLTVLVWGRGRALPVRLESLTVTEEAFAPTLVPIRASVDLSIQVLSYNDLPATDSGYSLFLAHQALKESMASKARSNATVPVPTELAGT